MRTALRPHARPPLAGSTPARVGGALLLAAAATLAACGGGALPFGSDSSSSDGSAVIPADGGGLDSGKPVVDLARPSPIDLAINGWCKGPNPQGCTSDAQCLPDQVCYPTNACHPSSCSCDPKTGSWVCTADCGGGACVPKQDILCMTPNPAGCAFTGCPPNSYCDLLAGCFPSQCKCDPATGGWACTDDCGGGKCMPISNGCMGGNPQGCRTTGCGRGFHCDFNSGCFPSQCTCDASGMWSCTQDCGGGTCKPDVVGCQGENPEGCINKGCPWGFACEQNGACTPSSCSCDPMTGQWGCTRDCGGGSCVPVAPMKCLDPSPAGCRLNGCPAGQECRYDRFICTPSECKCDTGTGKWVCTEDCGGGYCEDTGPAMCMGPNPQGCANTGCPSGQICDKAAGCAPSGCTCDPMSGSWLCTADCGGGVCVGNGQKTCPAPNPQGCIGNGCPMGLRCDLNAGCTSSSCRCDGTTGQWVCSRDCGGGICVK